jgi:CBS domain-containing protein
MSLGRICVREVDVAEPYESVQIAAERMHARNVGTLVILDEEKRPIGIITDRDLTLRVLAEGKDPYVTTVAEAMTHRVATLREDASIEAGIMAMRGGPYRRLVVVDEEGKLAGLVSMDDILDLLIGELSNIGELLQRESPTVLAQT